MSTTFTKKQINKTHITLPKSGNSSKSGVVLPKKPKMSANPNRKKDIPEGVWTKCPKCSNMLYDKELDDNLKVCPHCSHHFPIGARERIHSLVETCSFEEMDANMVSIDILKFTGVSSYTSKLDSYQNSTGLKDAIITG